MRIHLIAIGGAVMHNLAIALAANGHQVTGSDDEIYNPSRERLAAKGLLPPEMGWHPERITPDIDLIILGKHAREDNPELLKAKKMGLKILSFPEFVYEYSKDKKRVVVTGSHGKTTTTAMIMHILSVAGKKFDYLVGSQLEGFETMVSLSDAPVMVIEGDEYPASPLDLRPKMLFYKPDIAVTTGVAWDHINVFRTFEDYVKQFERLLNVMTKDAVWIWYANDPVLRKLSKKARADVRQIPYRGFKNYGKNGQTALRFQGKIFPLHIFGRHNLQNLKAAYYAVKQLGVSDKVFFESVRTFKGAAKRMQPVYQSANGQVFLDFAHAPSKVKATVSAVRARFPDDKLIACFELHTFSSLSKEFLPHYKGSMKPADEAFVFYSPHTLKMKRLAYFAPEDVARAFGGNVRVFTDIEAMKKALKQVQGGKKTLLWMSSGTFDRLDIKAFSRSLLRE